MTKFINYGIITGKTLATEFGFDEENFKCTTLKEMLGNVFSQNKGIYYTSCEAGLGIYSAEEVLNSKNQLFCVIPFENQAEKWSDNFRERYYTLHEKSVDTRFISKQFEKNCINDCENYITSSCDELFFITSQNDVIPQSVKSAFNSGKKITLINCDDFTIKIMKQEDF